MHKNALIVITLFALIIISCAGSNGSRVSHTDFSDTISKEKPKDSMFNAESVIVGAARFDKYLPLLKDKKVAMMVNQTSVVNGVHIVDTLLTWGVQIKTIFAPEHGFRGDHSAGAHVNSTVDEKTGLPIASLYGKTKKPTADMLKDIDVVVFDIQDVGVRFYTYISSMHYLMEACADNNIPFMVLDRPNPNGHYVDGPVLDPAYKSFIGMHPVPLVHGMTVGEFAKMINGEAWLESKNTCQLTVIPCKKYNHLVLYELPIRPSPNLPTMASVYLYPSLGLFEGTNVSIGRGTSKPFEVVGRPGQKQGSYSFTPKSIPGVSDDPKYEGKLCTGIDLGEFGNTYIVSSKRIYLDWLALFYKSNGDAENGEYFKSFFTKLAGTPELQKQIEAGKSQNDIYASWAPGIRDFKIVRKKYLLYSDFE
ncbi:MAG: hypothetical protein ACI8ZN_001995 [Bacteroidia bacterium]|jgi:uncharacterized protein YbbC (DUF1343 family)